MGKLSMIPKITKKELIESMADMIYFVELFCPMSPLPANNTPSTIKDGLYSHKKVNAASAVIPATAAEF